MFKKALAACLLLGFFCAPAHSADFIADSRIDSVTVYTSRAAITRKASIDVPAGAHTVIFKNLPGGILTDSLRVDGKAGANVVIGAVNFKEVNGEEITEERARSLAADIEALRDKRAVLEAEREAMVARRVFLENLGRQAGLMTTDGTAPMNTDPQQWQIAGQALESGMADVLKSIHAKEVEIRTVNKQIDKLEADWGAVNPFAGTEDALLRDISPSIVEKRADKNKGYEVSIPVESDKATKLVLSLQYQHPDAMWRPQYDIRLDTEAMEIKLAQYGTVTQKTGEDWTDVSLTLSTTQPHRGAILPELKTRWLDARDAAGGIAMSAGQNNADYDAARVESRNSVLPVPTGVQRGRIGLEEEQEIAEDPLERWRRIQEERVKRGSHDMPVSFNGNFVTEYRVSGPGNVKSGEEEVRLMIASYELKGRLRVHVQPQTTTNAYLAAVTTLDAEAPLLPGKASLFRDNSYTGEWMMPLMQPGKEQVLFFGIDDRFSVKRHTLKEEAGESGIIAKDQVVEGRYMTEIQNLHKMSVEVVMSEAIPVSRNEKIKVDILPDTMAGYERDADKVAGQLRWTMQLQPQEKKEIKTGVKVSWPADINVSGL